MSLPFMEGARKQPNTDHFVKCTEAEQVNLTEREHGCPWSVSAEQRDTPNVHCLS